MNNRKFKADRGDGIFVAFVGFIWGIGIIASLAVPVAIVWGVITLVTHFTS